MKASLSLDELKYVAKNMKVEVPFTAIDVDKNILLFLFMTDSVKKVKKLRESKTIATEINYNKELNAFLIFLVPI